MSNPSPVPSEEVSQAKEQHIPEPKAPPKKSAPPQSLPASSEEKPSKSSEPSFRLNCPYCQRRVKAYLRHLGRKVRCPRCQRPFLVQLTPQKEAEPDAQDSNPRSVALSEEEQKAAAREDLEQLEAERLPAHLLKHQKAYIAGGFVVLVLLAGVGIWKSLPWLAPSEHLAPDASFGWTRHPELLPLPVRHALESGFQVWELRHYPLLEDPAKGSVYVVLDGSRLHAVVGVVPASAREAQRLIGPQHAPRWGTVKVWFWYSDRTTRIFVPELRQEINAQWSFQVQEDHRWVIRREEKFSNRKKSVQLKDTIQVVVDPEVHEGYWELSRQVQIRHRGTQAYLGSYTREQQRRGEVYPVLAQ